MKAATHELAPLGIRVNIVAPGPTATDMLDRFTGGHPEALAARVPLGRAATAEEVAEAAVWLASDGARFVNGAVLPVNGGDHGMIDVYAFSTPNSVKIGESAFV